MKDHVLELDKSRTLRFGFKAMRTIRNRFGDRSLDQLMSIKVDEIPVLAWAGLTHEDKALTIEQVEDLLDEAIPKTYTILKVTELIIGALSAQMGVEPKKVKADVPTVTAEIENPEAVTEEKKQPTKTIPSTKKQKKSP